MKQSLFTVFSNRLLTPDARQPVCEMVLEGVDPGTRRGQPPRAVRKRPAGRAVPAPPDLGL